MENQIEKVMGSFKELEGKWGKVVLIDHLIGKTKLSEDELKPLLENLKSKNIISEPREGCFIKSKN